MDKSDLAVRMKDYEGRNRYCLQKRIPVIIRLDMKSGHSFCRGFQRPFDEIFIKTMQDTAKCLCENIMNVKMSYQQSDEISLLLVDYEKLNSESFFNYRVDKLCSIAASMATMEFNKVFQSIYSRMFMSARSEEEKENLYNKYGKKCYRAMFDARCFNIPKEEVTNYIYWRQLDATRNSIQMVGQANFPHKELQNKSCNDIQDMLMTQKGINWNNLPTYQKRGSCVVKEKYCTDNNVMRSRWIIDKKIPIFKNEGRNYIEKLIMVGE